MTVTVTDAQQALCHLVGNAGHAARPHISLSSLPSPDTPIVSETCPIDIRSETDVFRPRHIARLWTQVLSIYTQNGHFDALKPPLMNLQSRLENEVAATVARDVVQKSVLFLRHKIQKGLLTKQQPPLAEDMALMSEHFTELESHGELRPEILQATKVHLICQAVWQLDSIPGIDEYLLKSRAHLLYELYSRILEQHENAEKAQVLLLGQPAGVGIHGSHSFCLTQWTAEECAIIEEAAAACDPPLSRGVLELMCLFPHITPKTGEHDLLIVPGGRLIQSLDNFPELDRAVTPGGPKCPSTLFQLTTWKDDNRGGALFINVETGEVAIMSDYEPNEAGGMRMNFKVCAKSAEELLQELINDLLSLKFVPSGAEYIIPDSVRSVDYLDQKFLLRKNRWPTSFPLSSSAYTNLLYQQWLFSKARVDHELHSLDHQWNLLASTYSTLHPASDSRVSLINTALDAGIEDALRYHVGQSREVEYAQRAGVAALEGAYDKLELSMHVYSEGAQPVVCSPVFMLRRFGEVVGDRKAVAMAGKSSGHDWTVERMEKAVLEMKEVMDLDDDESGDFVGSETTGLEYDLWQAERDAAGGSNEDVDQEEEASPAVAAEGEDKEAAEGEEGEDEWGSSDGEFDVDEEDADMDFDLVMLVEDARTDIDDIIRVALEGHSINDN